MNKEEENKTIHTNQENHSSDNVPQLRFPEFEGEWERKKLGEVADVKTGPFGSSLHQHDYVEAGTPIITVEHLNDLGIVHNNLPLVSQSDKTRLKSYHLKTGDLVFSRVGSVDRCSLISSKENGWLFSGRLLRVRFENEFPSFFNYEFQLEETKQKVRSIAVGQTMPSINTQILKSIELSFPTLPEQKLIASFFTVLDKKIAEMKQKKSLLEKYKKGVMQKIFSQELRFKDEDGEEFPKWEEKRLGEIFSFRVTNSYSRENLNYDEVSVKNIHYGDIHIKFQSHFDLTKENVPFINSEIELKRIAADNYCKEGDLVIADASEDYEDVGKCIEIINLNGEKVLAGLHTILARPDKHKMSLGFNGHLMKSENIRLQIKTIAQGSKVLSISSTRLSNCILDIPTYEEQTKIANFLSAVDEKINRTQMQIEKTEQYKKGLLQKMFC